MFLLPIYSKILVQAMYQIISVKRSKNVTYLYEFLKTNKICEINSCIFRALICAISSFCTDFFTWGINILVAEKINKSLKNMKGLAGGFFYTNIMDKHLGVP